MSQMASKEGAAAAGGSNSGAVHLKISGYDVDFPFKPYASQLVSLSPRRKKKKPLEGCTGFERNLGTRRRIAHLPCPSSTPRCRA